MLSMLRRKVGREAEICTYIILLLAVGRILAVDIISSSKLETCIRNGTQGADNTDLSCRQKLVVVVSVDSGDSIASQDVEFTLSCIGSPTGACPCPCNYVADASCTCRDLVSSLTVSLSKGQLWSSYPLTYIQSFNYKPEEAIVRPPNGECKDGEYDASPTCAWYYLGGQKMVDSQGFVCYCTPGDIWDSTFGQNTKKSRAGLDCDFFSGFIDNIIGRRACSGHCLMMHPHWYGGYALGEASLQFEIEAQLTFSGNSSSEKLKLSPSTPVAISRGRTLAAKLLGDLAGYTQLPVLSEKLLMIPNPRSDQSIDSVFANRSEWMLVDRSRISFDGAECDKVGTSFTAFRHQANGCLRAEGTCLSNQLHHILESDKARIVSGQPPLYLVSQYARGLDSNLRQFAGGPLSYALPVAGIRSSLVHLETEADSLKFVVNTSPGAILAARVCTFAVVKCGGFEASAARGYLHAWIANKGTLAAAYTLTVSNCSVNIRPVEAQRFALAAGQNGSITPFEIYVEDDQAVEARSCWLTMLDSRGGVCDKKQVVFFTNATAYEEWPTGGLIGNGTGAGNQTQKDCSKVCSNRLDLICAAKNRCWGNVGGFFGLLAGTVLGAGLLFAAFKFGALGMLTQLCGPLLSCCGSGRDSKKKSSRSKYNSRDNPMYDDSADGQQYRKQHEKGKGSTHNDYKQQTTFEELFKQEQEWQQQRRTSYSKAGGYSSSIAYGVEDPRDSQAETISASYSTSGGKKRSSSTAGRNPTRWITAAPWDESAAGASGHIPAGRIKGSSIVQKAGCRSKAGSSSRSSRADSHYEHGQADDWQGLEVQRRLHDEDEDAEWDDPSLRRQSIQQCASAPGGPVAMSRDRPASRQHAARSQLTELINPAQRASKYLDYYDSESGREHSPERPPRGSMASARQLAAEKIGDPNSGYRQYSSTTQQPLQQQQYNLRKPDRVMSAPGRGSQAPDRNLTAVGAAARAVAANRCSSSFDRVRLHSRGFSDHELTEEEYVSRSQSLTAQQVGSALVVRSSRDNIETAADMATAAAAAARREGKHRSRSQPTRTSRTTQQFSNKSDRTYKGSNYMSDSDLQQRQLQQQYRQTETSRSSSTTGSSSGGVTQQRSRSIVQQQPLLCSRGPAALPLRLSNRSSPEVGQQRQRQQQAAASAAAAMQRGVGCDKRHQDSDFFCFVR